MTLEIAILLGILAVMAFFFFTEKLPVDLTAFLGLIALVFMGYVQPNEAFSGFASPAVITMLSVFIVSAALLHTGVADFVGAKVHALIGSREQPLIIAIMLTSGILSAFMNNIAAAAVLLPAVAAIAQKTGISPSKLFMPLSFGAILGGTTTLVGTPPNIIAADLLNEKGIAPFELFDFAPLGLILLGVGTVYMVFIGRKLNPERNISTAVAKSGDLAEIYKLEQGLFSFRIPPESNLVGQTLGQAKLGGKLGLQVVSVIRQGNRRRRLAPAASTLLKAGDVLIVKGMLKRLEQLLEIPGTETGTTESGHFDIAALHVAAKVLILRAGSSLIGTTIASSQFRETHGATVIAVKHKDHWINRSFVDEPLSEDDELIVFVDKEEIEYLSDSSDWDTREVEDAELAEMRKRIVWLKISSESPLVGKTIRQCHRLGLRELFIVAINRKGRPNFRITPDEVLQAGDRLFLVGRWRLLQGLTTMGDMEAMDNVPEDAAVESDDVGVVEVTLAPRSRAAGMTLKQLDFREKHGLQVLSVWRSGNPIHRHLATLQLQFGDALLVQGPWDKIHLFGDERDYVVLSPIAKKTRRYHKAPYALAGLMFMVACVVTGFQPIHVAAFAAASLVVLFGSITMEEAYRNVEWRAVFLVAAILPVGIAMERTGASDLLARMVTESLGPLGPYAVMAGLFALSSFLSQCLDGAPAVVLVTPMALQIAAEMGISPYPIMMGVSLAASAAFMTPFSHKANLLVMGAGGYRVIDYIRVGTPLTIVVLILLVLLVPVFFPLYV